MSTTIRRASDNEGGHRIHAQPRCRCSSAAIANGNATATTRRVQFRGIWSLSTDVHMTGAQSSVVHSQVEFNYIAAIKLKALGGASMTNLSGLPNAGVHNRGYNRAQWGGIM